MLTTPALIPLSSRMSAASRAFFTIAPMAQISVSFPSLITSALPASITLSVPKVFCFSPRVSYGARSLRLCGEFHHGLQFSAVFRRHDGKIRHMLQVAEVKYTVVRFSVRSYYAGSVYTEYHRQLLQTYIFHYLIVSTLPKTSNKRRQKASCPPLQVRRKMLQRDLLRSPHQKLSSDIHG